MFKLPDEQLVGPTVDAPVDSTDLIARMIFAVISKLDALPVLQRRVSARVEAFDATPPRKAEPLQPSQILQTQVFSVEAARLFRHDELPISARGDHACFASKSRIACTSA